MKLPGFLIIIFLFQSCVAEESKTISYSGKDVDMKEIFAIIKTQTGVLFFYDSALLRNAKPVTVNWENMPLETALNEIFKTQSVTWVMEEKTVTIIKRPGT